jgi:hypothetical protein
VSHYSTALTPPSLSLDILGWTGYQGLVFTQLFFCIHVPVLVTTQYDYFVVGHLRLQIRNLS